MSLFAAPGARPVERVEDMGSLAKYYMDGGFFMHLITLLMGLGIAITVERFYFLVFKFNLDGRKFFAEIRRKVESGDISGARGLCGDAPLCRILGAALGAAPKGERAVQIAVDEEALSVLPTVEKRLHYLSMVANVSTLLGLLGTIQGLIGAFEAVSAADPSQKAVMLASGISMAMLTTFYGLIVAVPIMMVYSYLQARATKIVDEIDEYSVKLINLLSSRQKGS